jgi:hypothetical protein
MCLCNMYEKVEYIYSLHNYIVGNLWGFSIEKLA